MIFVLVRIKPSVTRSFSTKLPLTKTFYLTDILTFYLACILAFFLARLSAREEEERTTLMKSRDLRSRFHQRCPLLLFPGILFGISSDILAGICIWHIFWHYVSGIPSDILSGILSEVRRGPLRVLAVKVRQGPLWSWACCSGPAETTAISRLQLRSGRDYSDPGLAVRVRQG